MSNVTTIALLNTEDTYKQLQPFSTIEELNANTTEIRAQYADQMTPSTYAVLDVLHRYASKYYGVSYRSKAKIAISLGITRRTVIRACNALEALGVIKQYELKRHNGDKRRSSNAIVFVPLLPNDTSECHVKDAPNNSPSNSSTTYATDAAINLATKNVVKGIKNASEKTDKETDNRVLLKESLPSGWYEQVFAYTSDYDDMYRITGELFKAKVNTNIRIETHVEAFGAVLRSAYGKLKNGRINPSKWYAYIFHAFRRKAHALERAETTNPIMHGIASLFDA